LQKTVSDPARPTSVNIHRPKAAGPVLGSTVLEIVGLAGGDGMSQAGKKQGENGN
jgi:hypothetical protein